jgi:hypothetical protein
MIEQVSTKCRLLYSRPISYLRTLIRLKNLLTFKERKGTTCNLHENTQLDFDYGFRDINSAFTSHHDPKQKPCS